jgi:hypothetical protein
VTQNSQPVRVGIAGLGRSGWGIHQNALKDLKDTYQIVAVADTDKSRSEEAAAEHGYRAYSDVADLVKDNEVELIVVATPNRFHGAQALQALEAGKHVVCEKPFGFTVADVDAMIAAAEKSKKFATVEYSERLPSSASRGMASSVAGTGKRHALLAAVNCITMARIHLIMRWSCLALPTRRCGVNFAIHSTAAMWKTKCVSS